MYFLTFSTNLKRKPSHRRIFQGPAWHSPPAYANINKMDSASKKYASTRISTKKMILNFM